MEKRDVSRECGPGKIRHWKEIGAFKLNTLVSFFEESKPSKIVWIKDDPRTNMMLTWLGREDEKTCNCSLLFLASAKSRAYLLAQFTWLKAPPTLTWGTPSLSLGYSAKSLWSQGNFTFFFWMEQKKGGLGIRPGINPSTITYQLCDFREITWLFLDSVSTIAKPG